MGRLVRVATAGSVDDGKSTLIGRLLYDSRSIADDEVDAVAADLSMLTDGLRAEREQGITIDVAYRYFATPRRAFIIADTPGHPAYTRNMVTGASTANLAIVLVDARKGMTEQSRRHAFIAAVLGAKQGVEVLPPTPPEGVHVRRAVVEPVVNVVVGVLTGTSIPEIAHVACGHAASLGALPLRGLIGSRTMNGARGLSRESS